MALLEKQLYVKKSTIPQGKVYSLRNLYPKELAYSNTKA
jgi:hypothetical protein